jgi:hypothetical protein
MPTVTFRGGGSLDGGVMGIPQTAGSVRLHGSHYVIEDAGDAVAAFVGHGDEGAEMARISREQRDHDAREQEAVLAAMQPKSCQRCGCTFGDQSAYTVHSDDRWPDGCVPAEVCGLVDVDGVLCMPGSDAARR